jgi:cysteinyl-tRNA synthetase
MNMEDIDFKVALREDARKLGDYEMADAIREELLGVGVILEDRRNGTTRWRFE